MSGSDHLSQHTHMSNFEQMSRNFVFNVLKYLKNIKSLKRSKEVKTGLALKTHKNEIPTNLTVTTSIFAPMTGPPFCFRSPF